MKRKPTFSVGTVVIIGAVGLLLLWLGVFGGTTTVVENNTAEVEQVATSTEPAYPDEWIKEAEEAKKKVLRRKELEQESSELNEQIKKLETRQAEIEKELGF